MTIKSILRQGRPEIDLTGPEGNVFFLMARAKGFAKELERNPEPILADMKSADYEHAIDVFEREFGEYVTLYR